ncbi:MAG: hypothetical protein IKR98_06695 [Bacteroidaceae bacterium]|nr:hypothetical protein [Bacteroidaceae bacterium]
MRKLLLLLLSVLLAGVSGAWAALSESTIAKSGNVTDTWNITSALPTDNWTAMGDATPTGVTALGSYTAYYRTQNITLSNEGALFITFLYSTGSHQLEILGVDLLNSNDEVVRSDYHYGKTGTSLSHNVYMLDHIASGDYKIRFIINSGVSNSVGNITVKHLNIKTSNSYENITNWYFVRMHSNQTNYMYYDKSERGIAFSSPKQNNAHYLWGFVKDTDGIRIYNKAAGSSVALDNANPCTLSASGTSLAFTFGSGSAGNNGAAAGAYFSLYMNPDRSATARSYLNYRSDGTIQRWGGDDAGSAWMIDETTISAPFVSASEGKIYKIQAYFSDSDNLYFTNNGTNLAFNNSASSGVNDYWILRSSGNGNYPWSFESGRGDGKFLSSTDGLANTGVYLQINNIDSYFNLRGSKDGNAKTSSIVNLGTWSGSKSGFGAYGDGGCWSTDGNSDRGWSTKYTIEEVTDVDIYTVVSNINAGGVNKTTYTGKSDQTNGGFYILDSAPSAGDFSAISVTDFTPGAITVNTTTKTITVNYSSSYSYTLTDVNGQEYTGTITGEFGVTPTLTGCDGYTLSNEAWDEENRTYTADITFPFPVSSNNVTNWTYIGNFANSSNNYATSSFCWFVKSSDATKVYSGQDKLPTNQSGEQEKWEWSITPTCTAGAFSFTIKNASTNKYVTMAETPSAAFANQISLTDIGTAFTFDASHRWKLPTATELYISQNSSSATEQEVGVYGPNGSHGAHSGNYIAFITPADFTSLMSELKAARTSFNNYFLYWSQGKYSETEAGTMTTVYNQLATDRNVVNDPPTAYFNATQFKTYTDNYNNAVAGLNYVMPTGKFIRIKNVGGTKYVKDLVANYNTDETLDYAEGGTDAASVFYVDASSKMIAYNSGLYLFATNNTPRITLQGSADTYEFLKGSAPLQVYVHSANNPLGWGGDNRYWSVNESTSKIDRVASTTSASEFKIESVTSLPVTISSAHYATFSAPVAVTVPTGVTAYYGTTTGADVMYLAPINSGSVIPANMGVILYAETPNTYNFAITDEEGSGSSILSGTTAAISWASGYGYYTLQKTNGGDGVGLYGNAPTNSVIPGFKAYYNSNSPSGVKGYRFNFGDENGVKTLEEIQGAIDNNEIFDMSGRRIAKAARGLYIVNGKKLLVK